MQDLITLEMDCPDEDLHRMRVVPGPDRTNRHSGNCRSERSVLHNPAVTLAIVRFFFMPGTVIATLQKGGHCNIRTFHSRHAAATRLNEPSAARNDFFEETMQETVGPPVAGDEQDVL